MQFTSLKIISAGYDGAVRVWNHNGNAQLKLEIVIGYHAICSMLFVALSFFSAKALVFVFLFCFAG
jgi:hypothetical protein